MQAPRSQGCNQRSGAAFLIFALLFTRLTRIAGFCRRMQLHGDDGCSLLRALLDCHSLVPAGGLQCHQHRGLCSPCTSIVKDCPRQRETTICHGVASNYHILIINPPSISYPLLVASGHADTATPRWTEMKREAPQYGNILRLSVLAGVLASFPAPFPLVEKRIEMQEDGRERNRTAED